MDDKVYVYIPVTNEIKSFIPCAYNEKRKRFILDPWGETIFNICEGDIVETDLEALLELVGDAMSEEDKEWYRNNL